MRSLPRREYGVTDEFGNPDSQHAVVMLHPGALERRRILEPLAKQFVNDDVRGVSLDLESYPGFVAPMGGHLVTARDLIGSSIRLLREAGITRSRWDLAGWSFGGAIAYGLAAALSPHERPQTVTAIDSVAPTDEFTILEENVDTFLDGPDLRRWFAWYLAAKRRRPFDVDLHDITGYTPGDVVRGLERIREAAITAGALSATTEAAGLRKVFDVFAEVSRRNNRIIRDAQPLAPEVVPVTLVRAQHSIFDVETHLGWRRLCAGTLVAEVPGNHYSMLDDEQTYRCLRDAVLTHI